MVGDLLAVAMRFGDSSTHRPSIPMAAVDESCSPLMLARSRKPISKYGESLKSLFIPIHAPGSMASSGSVSLVDHRPHRSSDSLDLVVKMAAKGLTLIRQISSNPAPSASNPDGTIALSLYLFGSHTFRRSLSHRRSKSRRRHASLDSASEV